MLLKRSITSAGLLLVGFVAGWWLGDSAPETRLLQPELPASSTGTQAALDPHPRFTEVITHTKREPLPVIELARPIEVARFEQLLNRGEFEEAMAFYENALEIDDGFEALLKPRLEKYLEAHLRECADDAFVDLVELWLESYYEDISVLLLLAENQRFCGAAEEAARTLLVADTYALAPGQKARVTAAVNRLVEATDKSLSEEQSWTELLNFYEFLQVSDLATNSSRLRMASLYQLLGDSDRSRDLLRALKQNDDGLDPEWTAAIDLQWARSTHHASADDPPRRAMPLTRRGDHFLLAASLNDVNPLILMIDTGASVTTLSRESFTRVDGTGLLGYRGTRLFNTANGMARGDVYLASSLSLGDTRISAVEIAVLDYDSSPGIDGVLGMNVLRNFRFEIDQDKDILYLRPRP